MPRLGPAVAKAWQISSRVRFTKRSAAPNPNWRSSSPLLTLAGDPKKAGIKKGLYSESKIIRVFCPLHLVVRSLSEVGAKWGDAELTAQLHGQWEDYYPKHYNHWEKLTKACIDHILEAFARESKREREDLTYANYFKSQSA